MTPFVALTWAAALCCLWDAWKVIAVEVVFAVRQAKGPHWYENFGYQVTDPRKTCYGEQGRLCRLNLEDGQLTVLLEDIKGTVRDPCVDYNGRRIVFSYRPASSDRFHLYEIMADGRGLHQLTEGDCDDLEPCILPDGGIVFCSSRCHRFVPCWYVPVAILYRCNGDGTNVRPLSSNVEQDNTPWVLPDGRILYTRWEYVDRSREHFHHLWVMNPDGTGQMAFYGNMLPGDVFLDAKPLPHSSAVVMINSPNHGRLEHEGRVAIVEPGRGPDAAESQRLLHAGQDFRDPYPVDDGNFLIAQRDRLLMMNTLGEVQELYRLPAAWASAGAWIHEPRVLRPRYREPVIPAKVNLAESEARIIVADIYHGRNMAGVRRGTIRKLLVLENLPKPVNFTGSMDPISYGGSYTLNRILGTVPVEPDGSVHAVVPPLRSLQLVALDDRDLSVKRMLSFMTLMPGEVASCTGCHEKRTEAPPPCDGGAALLRPPNPITPIAGIPDVFDYPRDIQPVWNKHCLPCHDTATYAGRALLTGDRGPIYSHSYFTLSARLQIADGRDLARGNYAPYSIGSSASPLIHKLEGRHHDVSLTDQEMLLVKLWVDASATFPGTYAALGSGMIGSYAELQYGTRPKTDYLSWPGLKAANAAMNRRCSTCHTGSRRLPASPADDLDFKLHHLEYDGGKPRFWEPPWLRPLPPGSPRPGSVEWMRDHADPRLQFSRHILYNLTRPDQSVLILAPLAKTAGGHATCGDIFATTTDPDYQALLRGIEEAANYLRAITRFDMPGFRPPPEYLRELRRYGIVPAASASGEPFNVYELDRRYWASFWHQPERLRGP